MSETVPLLAEGFSPENMERICMGEPALVDGETPGDVLKDREFEAVSHVVDGLSYGDIATKMKRSPATVNTYLTAAYACLGIVSRSRSQLAGYFPLSADHKWVKGKKLADLEGHSTSRALDISQELSAGLTYAQIAADRPFSYSMVSSQVYEVGQIWPDAKGGLLSTTVVNAIRARYLQAIKAGTVSVKREEIGEPTLTALAEFEPVILHDLELAGLCLPDPTTQTPVS